MFGWTLFDAILGGEAVELLGDVEFVTPAEDEDQGRDDELVLPDYAKR